MQQITNQIPQQKTNPILQNPNPNPQQIQTKTNKRPFRKTRPKNSKNFKNYEKEVEEVKVVVYDYETTFTVLFIGKYF